MKKSEEHFQRSIEYFLNLDYKKALQHINVAIALNPSEILYHSNKGDILYMLKKFEDALRSYDYVLLHYPKSRSILNKKASILLDLELYENAIKVIDLAISYDPEYYISYCNKSAILNEMHKYQESLEVIDIALKLEKNKSVIYINRGAALLSLGFITDSIDNYLIALELSPESDECLHDYANALIYAARYDEALHHINKAIEINPNSIFFYKLKTKCLLKMKNYKGAIDCFLIIEEMLKNGDIEYLFEKDIHDIKKFLALKDIYQSKMTQDNINKSYLLFIEGKNLCREEKYEESINFLLDAIKLKDDEYSYYNVLGNAYYHLNRFDDAIASYNKALMLNQNSHSVHNNLGNIYYQLDQPTEALKFFEIASNLSPSKIIYKNNIGSCLSKLGRLEEALSYIDEAIMIQSDNPLFNANKAECLYNMGRYKLALEILDHTKLLFHKNSFQLSNSVKNSIAKILLKRDDYLTKFHEFDDESHEGSFASSSSNLSDSAALSHSSSLDDSKDSANFSSSCSPDSAQDRRVSKLDDTTSSTLAVNTYGEEQSHESINKERNEVMEKEASGAAAEVVVKEKGKCVIMSVHSIKYGSPILNRSDITSALLSTEKGREIFTKLISLDFTDQEKILTEMGSSNIFDLDDF